MIMLSTCTLGPWAHERTKRNDYGKRNDDYLNRNLTYNTIKTKCQDQQHNQNKMSGPTTQPKQNARTYNTTITKCQEQTGLGIQGLGSVPIQVQVLVR